VARVYFVDDKNAQIPIPDGFQVQDNSNGDIPVLPLRDQFFLGWTDNYSLLFNGTFVIRLSNQRQWEIQGPPQTQVLTTEN